MQSPPPETYTYPQRVPESTNDVNLKRARVVDNDGKSYIRVTGTVTSSDLDPIKEALGEPTDTSSDNTVIGLLKKIDVKQFGVGQAYPGSTGGEIFNYYGTDSHKNVASGNYSTAMGYNNEANGFTSFVSGQHNVASGSSTVALGNYDEATASHAIAIGSDCHSTASDAVTVGYSTENSGEYSSAFGSSNTISADNCVTVGIENNAGQEGNVLVGKDLHNDTISNLVILGQYNTTPTLSGSKTVIASGSDPLNEANAIECNANTTKICNNLQLATNAYEVNDITAPLSTPASAEDKTLATKAYVDANGGFTPESTEIYADHIYTTDEPPIDLGEIPYQKGRVVLRGTLTMSGYSFANDEAEATFEARFDLTAPYIDQYVQQTIFSYDSNKFVAVTLTIKFHIISGNHLEITLQNNELSGVVFYDQYRVAQGHNVPPNVNFNTMNSHSYFYNY